ncbi:hypothetical protein [Vibrio mediterranei]|uniref:hypothetical protein n=1 Tax=Vibrio mediterranei TaxID=689 RepID=UPI00148CC199|nr:hypothetical protein [Vibrio mediterranei]NOH29502.1 hypothetical protein [Vibrio mediterranei]
MAQNPTLPMLITSSGFVENAWNLDFRIISAEEELLSHQFVLDVTNLAQKKGIEVHSIDLEKCTFNRSQKTLYLAEKSLSELLEDRTNQKLIWFNNIEPLVSGDPSIVHYLRGILTPHSINSIQSVFIGSRPTLRKIFKDTRAPFYDANFRITK